MSTIARTSAGLRPHAVADLAKHQATNRTRHEPHGKGAEGGHLRQGRGERGREKHRRENKRGGGPVNEEIIPFDRGPGRSHQRHTQPRAILLVHVLRQTQLSRKRAGKAAIQPPPAAPFQGHCPVHSGTLKEESIHCSTIYHF
jgi:hypothetical protein